MDRAYTVKEIDDLRRACEMRWLFGTTKRSINWSTSRSYQVEEKIKCVEEFVRTYMLAGVVAADIYADDAEKTETANVEVTGAAPDAQQTKPQEIEK
jgi:hypothetical protein